MLALDFAVLAVALLCVALAWASRGNLNVDGAAYLDLAGRLLHGDWDHFVQGYWSPAYPTLLAIVLAIVGASGSEAVAAAHALNLIVALAGVVILWRAARRRANATWGILVLTAFLFASARTVRIDAVTPDLLLLTLLAGFAVELVRPEGWRGARLGAWAGAAFLAKTSVWPWMVIVGIVAAVAVRGQPERRRRLWQALAVALVPVALWTAAMSIDAGRPTLGSSGRLNACWYLLTCDGRTPDSHTGGHEDYHSWILAASNTARVATFEDAEWTYAPWSDPSAWQLGIVSQEKHRPTVFEFVVFAATHLGLVLGVWLAFLIGAVLLPTALTTRGAPTIREVVRTPIGLSMVLGVVGILQFVAVHAEPRLIAPFAMLFAVGFLSWRQLGTARVLQWPVAVVGLVLALGIGVWHLRDQLLVTASSQARTMQLEGSHPASSAPHRVAVVGAALPMMPDLYRARAIVVAQVTDPAPDELAQWPPAAQAALAGRLRAQGATTLWISRGRDAYRIVPLATPPTP